MSWGIPIYSPLLPINLAHLPTLKTACWYFLFLFPPRPYTVKDFNIHDLLWQGGAPCMFKLPSDLMLSLPLKVTLGSEALI